MVRDRRRIDPETGRRKVLAPDQQEVTETMSGTLDDEVAEAVVEDTSATAAAPQDGSTQDGSHQDAEPEVVDSESAEAAEEAEPAAGTQARVDELTADLKRVSAEYANYRKRVERDREAVITTAKAAMVADLLTVLDDIERADAHGDLTGAFKAVSDKLFAALTAGGLEPFGAQGDEFDPSVHQAVQHDTSPEVSGPTVTTVLRRGYRLGERVLRPAMVGVTDHEPAKPESQAPDQDRDQNQDQVQEPEQGRKQDDDGGQEKEQPAEGEQES